MSTTNISKREKLFSNQRGSMLMVALLGMSLGILLFFGSLKLINQSQKKVALQSRLDICAVKLAAGREHLLRQIAITNYYLKWTIWIVNGARGLKVLGILFPPLEIAAGASEQIALQANQATAAFQQYLLAERSALEVKNMWCASTPFSSEPAACTIKPMLSGATLREKPFFPDLKGELRWNKNDLGKIACEELALKLRRLATKLTLSGDFKLVEKEFTDAYEK